MGALHLQKLHRRLAEWLDGRTSRTPAHDSQPVAKIFQQLAELPSQGDRHACALVNRLQAQEGLARVNPKRAYRVMA